MSEQKLNLLSDLMQILTCIYANFKSGLWNKAVSGYWFAFSQDVFHQLGSKNSNRVLQSGQTTLFLVMHLYTVHSVTVVYKHSYFQT